MIDAWFQRGGAAPALPMELGNTEAIKKLVESGLGLSVTSWFAAKAEVRARRLTRGAARPAALPPDRHRAPARQAATPVLDAFLATLDDLRRSKLLSAGVSRHILVRDSAGGPRRPRAEPPAAAQEVT